MNLGLLWSAAIIVVWILTSEDQKMNFTNELQTDKEFRLTAPEGENQDEDSLGELSTEVGIKIVDDSRDLIDEPIDYCGDDYCGYEDYEPNMYDGTYSEM